MHHPPRPPGRDPLAPRGGARARSIANGCGRGRWCTAGHGSSGRHPPASDEHPARLVARRVGRRRRWLGGPTRQRRCAVRTLARRCGGGLAGWTKAAAPADPTQPFDLDVALASVLDLIAAAVGDGCSGRGAGPRRLPRDRRSPAIHRLVAAGDEQLPPRARRRSPPGRLRPCRWPGCGRGASCSRFEPRISASQPRRPMSCSGRPRSSWSGRTSTRSPSGRRAGPRCCAWPRCRSRAASTRPRRSGASARRTASSSTTSWRKSSPACRRTCRTSSCERRSSIASAGRCATRSRADPLARRGWRISSGPTC